MKRSIKKSLWWVFTSLYLLFFGVYIYVLIAKPDLYSNSGGPSFRIHLFCGVECTATDLWGGQVAVYNHGAPYTGSILDDSAKIVGAWNACGCYFRHIAFASQIPGWWTFMFSLWYPIIIFGAFPAITLLKIILRQMPQTNSGNKA